MRWLRRQSFWRSLRRRLSAGMTLVAYLLTAFGVPMPAGATTAAACGCISDEYCHSGGCCCSNKGKPVPKRRAASCCTGKPGCDMPCCRQDKPSSRCPHQQGSASCDDDSTSSGVRWVNGIAAMKCRGHSTIWVSAGVVLPAPAPLAALPAAQPIGRLVYADEAAASTHPIPPVPPPRSMQA